MNRVAGDEPTPWEDVLDDCLMLIDEPSPFVSMKVLRNFVRRYEDSKNRSVRRAVESTLASIARREADPGLDKRIEDGWANERAALLAAVPDIKSNDDATAVAEQLIHEHGGKAVAFVAQQRDKLFHELGEEKASASWQRVVTAICELQPKKDRRQPP